MSGIPSAVLWLTAGLLLLWAALLFHRLLAAALGVLLRSTVGLAALALLQNVGGFLGITLGANLGNALVLGLLGMPGFGLLLMLQWLLRT